MLFSQCQSNADKHMLTQNVETTLGYRLWIDVIMLMLFQRCFVNAETMSINTRRLNFIFQPNFNVETILVPRHWIDVILSMLFQRCFVNAETTSINIRRLNFIFQPNFNVETILVPRHWIDVILSMLFQRCICQRWNNVDKYTSAQLSLSTKYQRWNNVDES